MLSLSEVEHLYDENVDKIYRFFYYRVLTPETAEDLTSETFLQLVSEVKQHKDIENPVRFLFGIAKNVFLKFLRNKYHTVIELPFNAFENMLETRSDEPDDIDARSTLEEQVRTHLNKLPESQKKVMTLRLIEKMSIAEIAAKLGKDSNYVKTNQKRAVKSLRKLIACTPSGTNI